MVKLFIYVYAFCTSGVDFVDMKVPKYGLVHILEQKNQGHTLETTKMSM